MTPLQYCQAHTAPVGSTLYYSLRYLPPQQYEALLSIFAFALAIRKIPYDCQDAGVAKAKLVWWRDEIQRLSQAQPTHPMTQALQPVLQQFNLDIQLFQDYIGGILENMKYQGYHKQTDLIQHCHRLSYIPNILAAKILGCENNQEVQKFLHHLGIALSLFELIYELREDTAKGRVYFPTEDLNHFSLNATDLIQSQPETSIKQLLTFEANRAREFYQTALKDLPTNQRQRFHPYLIQAAITFKLLDEIEEDGFRVLTHRIALTPLRKFWIAWRIRRNIKRF